MKKTFFITLIITIAALGGLLFSQRNAPADGLEILAPAPRPTNTPLPTRPGTTSTATLTPTNTPTPPTPTVTPAITSTATISPTVGENLLSNPGFTLADGSCPFPEATAIPGWGSAYFEFKQEATDFVSADSCGARAKRDDGLPSSGIIPPGESAVLSQTVAAPGNYSAIVLADTYVQHETGTITHRIRGCQTPDVADCVTVFETDRTVPYSSTRPSACDIYEQVFVIERAGTVTMSFSIPAAGCDTSGVPAAETWSIAAFDEYPYLLLEIVITPATSGASGYKSDSVYLGVVP